MRGLLHHFMLTLKLNFRSRQALVYGYLVPVFFLIAFGGIFRAASPPLMRQLGQLLTITILGGACFGMPTALVAERQQGVWRRFRLLPAGAETLLFSTVAARFILILSAAIMQVVLASLIFGMPMPQHPVQLSIAYTFVALAFLGMGLVIAMLADNVPAVQALGQAIFLPMIMIGGVGVPLWTLPTWARHVANFLPGKYAVEALQACVSGDGLGSALFDLGALFAIGVAAGVAGTKMFRWDPNEKVIYWRRWLLLSLAIWVGVGVAAEIFRPMDMSAGPALQTAEGYESITIQQVNAITYDDLEDDAGTVTPVAKDLNDLSADAQGKLGQFRKSLAGWGPGKDPSATRRVRNFLEVAAIADITIHSLEGPIALVIFEELKGEFSRDVLEKILTYIILQPDEKPILAVPELGIDGDAPALDVQERSKMYARKLLGRLLGKIPATRP